MLFLNNSGEYRVFLPVAVSERVDLPININRIILKYLMEKILTRKTYDSYAWPACAFEKKKAAEFYVISELLKQTLKFPSRYN